MLLVASCAHDEDDDDDDDDDDDWAEVCVFSDRLVTVLCSVSDWLVAA